MTQTLRFANSSHAVSSQWIKTHWWVSKSNYPNCWHLFAVEMVSKLQMLISAINRWCISKLQMLISVCRKAEHFLIFVYIVATVNANTLICFNVIFNSCISDNIDLLLFIVIIFYFNIIAYRFINSLLITDIFL